MSEAFQALQEILRPDVLLVIVLAGAYGLFFGAVPGLTATMAVALFVPFTFGMDTIPALAAIVTLEAMAIFAGDIPSTLVRIPGTPSSAAYTDDAYALTCRGESRLALGVSLIFSVAGGIFGGLVLIVAAPWLAAYATQFSSYEKFWLAILGLSSAAIVAQGSIIKGLFALLLGLGISTIGLDEIHGLERMTFGTADLFGGVSFIPAMIGLFGLSEVLRNVCSKEVIAAPAAPARGRMMADAWRLLLRRPIHFLRSSSIGTLIGILPGAGADIAAWVAFAASKRFSKTPQEYGKGSIEGVSDATAANNSALAGAWVPALVLGIPGDSVTAIVIGVLMMKNLQPGPEIFEKQPVLIYSVYWAFLVANVALIFLGWLAIRAGGLIVRLPRKVLLPVIVLFSIIGAFAINNSVFDIGVMLAMGALGFVLERHGFPVGPVVLGIVLGPMVESNFMISMINSAGNPLAFVARPQACVLGVLTALLWLAPAIRPLLRRARKL